MKRLKYKCLRRAVRAASFLTDPDKGDIMIRTMAGRLLPHTDWGNRLYWRILFMKRLGRCPPSSPQRFTDHLHWGLHR